LRAVFKVSLAGHAGVKIHGPNAKKQSTLADKKIGEIGVDTPFAAKISVGKFGATVWAVRGNGIDTREEELDPRRICRGRSEANLIRQGLLQSSYLSQTSSRSTSSV
jgi:hypothetical protein